MKIIITALIVFCIIGIILSIRGMIEDRNKNPSGRDRKC